jgi:hypothetical protein
MIRRSFTGCAFFVFMGFGRCAVFVVICIGLSRLRVKKSYTIFGLEGCPEGGNNPRPSIEYDFFF